MNTDDHATAPTRSAATSGAPRAPFGRSLPIFLITLACVFAGAPGGTATPIGAAPVTSAPTTFHDDVVEVTAGQAADVRVARASLSRQAWRATRSVARHAVAWVRRAIGRWHQPPPAWRGPPILLT